MDTSQWYYTRGGVQQGAVTLDELRRLAEAGQFGPADLVWHEGMTQWEPAYEATPFFGAPPPAVPQGSLPPPGYAPPPGTAIGYVSSRPADLGDSAAVRMLIPVGRSPWAIAAGYLGLFSLFGGFVAPVSIVVSIVAIRDIRAHPEKHGMGRAITGLVLGIIGTIMLVVIIIAIAAEASR